MAHQDPDLRELRDTREWIDMLVNTKGALSREAKVNLRAEAKVKWGVGHKEATMWGCGQLRVEA